MKLEGAQVIAADRMAVWNAINDPEILKRCISGCEEMNRTSPTQYDAIVKQKIGPVSATFKGLVNLSDVREGKSLRLDGEGKGGVAGMAKGGALVTLTDVPGGTQLSYDAEASVAGKLAQLGSRLIDGVAQKMINSFFENFKNEVEAGSPGATGGATASATAHHDGGGMGSAAVAGAVGAAAASASASASSAVDGVHTSIDAHASDAVEGVRSSIDTHAGDAMESARTTIDAHAGALHDVAADRMLNPAIGAGAGAIDMDDPDIGDIDVSSVDGGPAENPLAGASDAMDTASESVQGALNDASESVQGAVDNAAAGLTEARDTISDHVEVAVDSVTGTAGSEPEGSGTSGAAMAAGAAAAGGIGAAVSGFAARAQDTFDDVHETARNRVIAAGGDVDETKSWNDTKEHLGRAASESRDTAQDVYDAARARIDGDMERASAEWNEAKTNASEALDELKGGAEDAWTTGKGYAAEEAKAPRIGPLGQPWYLWIIGILVLLVILWIL